MKRLGSLLALAAYVAVLPMNDAPSRRDNPVGSLPPATVATDFLMVNAPAPAFQDISGKELNLVRGVDYEAFFFDAEDFFSLGLDDFDRTLIGNIKAAGADKGIDITPDRRRATLKNGQTVYYGVKVAAQSREKVRGVTFILTTVPKSGIPDIHNNFFEIAYVESVGGAAGNVKTDSTQGKAYQVINPNGDYWYYFSFKAVVRTGGIETTITPVFFGGPIVAAVAQKYIVCCWEEITTPLLDVPQCIPISWWYGCPIIDMRAVWAFQCALYKKIAANTANVACVNPEATGKALTILGAGFNALRDTSLTQAIHITDDQGSPATVTTAAVVSENEIAATFDVAACRPGRKCVTIDGAQGYGNVTFIEVINDMPPTRPCEMTFGAAVVRGTCDKVPLTLTTTGENVQFYTGPMNLFNVTKTTTCTPTQVSFFTCGNPTNSGSYIVKGTSTPGTQNISEYLGEPVATNLVTAAKSTVNYEAPKIRLVDIKGERKNELGNFEQETDPHKTGRIFVDTQEAWDGGYQNRDHYDKQRVKVTVEIMPNTLNPDDYVVKWELRDPDDPADHADIDPNPKGGDNSGKKHEGTTHWFEKADHDVSGQDEREATDETTVIGEAKTVITNVGGKLISTVFFYFSDDGGDNFKIEVKLLEKSSGQEKDSDKSGMLIVWRKYVVVKYATVEAKTAKKLSPLPNQVSTDTFKRGFGRISDIPAESNKNAYIDMRLLNSSGSARVGSNRETYDIGNNGRVRFNIDGSGFVTRLYQVTKNGAATALELVRSFTNNNTVPGLDVFALDSDKRVILEAKSSIEVDNDRTDNNYGDEVIGLWPTKIAGNNLNRIFTAYGIADVRYHGGEGETGIFASFFTNFHLRDLSHQDYTLQLMGWDLNSTATRQGGTAEPHSHVSYDHNKIQNKLSISGLTKTAIHECGHSLYTVVPDAAPKDSTNMEDYHNDHSDGYADCVAVGLSAVDAEKDYFCPRHIKNLRKQIFRAWSAEHQGESGE